MEVSLAVLCDYANVTADGKLNILGMFENIMSPSFPAKHASMFLVMRLSATPGEFNKKQTIEITLMGEDGESIMEMAGEAMIAGKSGENAEVNQILGINGLILPKEGRYAFHIVVNNQERKTVRLKAIKIPPQQAGTRQEDP